MVSLEESRSSATARMSRRALIASSVATAAAMPVAQHSLAHDSMQKEATPAASPVASSIDNDKLLDLSVRLVGGGNLAQDAVGGLAALLAPEPAIEKTLADLEALLEFTPESLAVISAEAQRIAGNILQYWYLGRYDGEPVPQRAGIYFSLVSWQALPYAIQPTLCKSFGYWTTDIQLGETARPVSRSAIASEVLLTSRRR